MWGGGGLPKSEPLVVPRDTEDSPAVNRRRRGIGLGFGARGLLLTTARRRKDGRRSGVWLWLHAPQPSSPTVFRGSGSPIQSVGGGGFFLDPPPPQGCIGTADNHRRRGGAPPSAPPPPPRDPDFIVGSLQKKILIQVILGMRIFGFQTPPPSSLLHRMEAQVLPSRRWGGGAGGVRALSSNTSLLPPSPFPPPFPLLCYLWFAVVCVLIRSHPLPPPLLHPCPPPSALRLLHAAGGCRPRGGLLPVAPPPHPH